jgi:FKBP-type peptidyl-prolyl cis-trans isomerase
LAPDSGKQIILQIIFTMKQTCFLIAIACFFLISCKRDNEREDGFSVTEDKLFYKLCKIGDGQTHPEKGDVLLLSVNYRTQKDSVFFDSKHNAWMGYFVAVNPAADRRCFKSYLTDMNEGDSMVFLMQPDAFFKELFDSETPYFSKKDSIVKAEVKLVAIMDSSDMDLYKQGRMVELKENTINEAAQILNYAKSQWKDFDSIPEAILFRKNRTTNDSAITEGKQVSLRYTGYFLDGRMFDNARSVKTFDFTYGSQQQLLPGLQMALGVMRKGEIAKIILPSQLAYGELGSGNIVPPYSPLLYEIEIVDVK